MMKLLGRLLLVQFCAAACAGDSPRVFESGGRILLQSPDAKTQELTASGRDFDPSITCDGLKVLFVRSDRDDPFKTSVYQVDVPTRTEKLVFAGPITLNKIRVHYLTSPELDEERGDLYVIAQTSVNTGTLCAVNLKTLSVRVIGDTATYQILRKGEYSGKLLLFQRKIAIDGSKYHVNWLYSKAGADLGIAGPETMDSSSLNCPDRPLSNSSPELSTTAQPISKPDYITIPSDELKSSGKNHSEPLTCPNSVERCGPVDLLLYLSGDGTVRDVKLLSGHPALAEIALSEARRWKYDPIAGLRISMIVQSRVRVFFKRID